MTTFTKHDPGPSASAHRHRRTIEIYIFTSTTEWIAYEGIQSDIFDHLLAMVSEFDLRVYQQYRSRPCTRHRRTNPRIVILTQP